jgi:hypothetical protein
LDESRQTYPAIPNCPRTRSASSPSSNFAGMRRRDCAGTSLQRDPYALNLRRSHDISPLFTKTSWNSGGMNYHGPRGHIQQERLLEKSLRPGQLVGPHTISIKIHAGRKHFFKHVISIAPTSRTPQINCLLQTRCQIVTWRKLKFLSAAAAVAALIATLAVARAVRSSGGELMENQNQAAPPHLQNNFACPPLVSAWDCEIIINAFPMSAGDRGSSSMPAMNI